MNRLQTYLGIFCCLVLSLTASISHGEEAIVSEETALPSAADVEMDDGTNMEGDLIIPKKMAMRCGISSKDGRDKEKIQECLNILASEGLDIVGIEQDMMHQVSKNALEKALQDYAAGTISDTELKMWRLISDFVENPDGTFSKKSLKQKAIDMIQKK